ncbi:MAG: response regulator [Opitutaceae bacterium]|nr:response regulator [Opitutaceae bacterium]
MAAPLSLRPIIVIDDEPDDLFFIRRLIEKGAVPNPVVTFLDSEDVMTFLGAIQIILRKVPEFTPCVLFTDLKMPKIDGFALVKWVRQQREFDGLTVVTMSSSDDPKDVELAKQLGADRYLLKYPGPGSLAELIAEASLHRVLPAIDDGA